KDYHVQGSKVFKTILIPTASGDLTIPSVSFVYFDPAAHAYKTLKSRPLTVHVAPGAAGAAAPALGNGPAGPAPWAGIKLFNEDIRYIKTPSSLFSQGPLLYRTRAYRWVNAFAFLMLFGSGMVPLYRRLFLSNPVLRRFKNARSTAKASMKEAEAALGRSE